jgi:site-specific DNA recombinase
MQQNPRNNGKALAPLHGQDLDDRSAVPELALIAGNGDVASTDGHEDGNLSAVIYLRVSTKEQAQKGGEAEGFSIPAQREACRRKAKALGATVVDEFVDRGESARSAKRPELQKMLAYVKEDPVTYVIVHKVDRLARNRVDDVEINLALQAAGATLVSCSESIDETPSGTLLHGIMSSIAEFYSRNLAAEVMKGLVQKAKKGGTVGKAPVGYRNVRIFDRGRETRTIEIDEERAPLVRWAFEVYATGDWSLTRLTNALQRKGLTNRPTTHYAEKPITRASIHRMLHNRYYIGKVTWQGVEYDGAHPTFISQDTFRRVQEILTAHNVAGEKQRVHNHYLKGSVWCEHCGSRLCITKTTNRHGTTYMYFFCVGRNQKRTGCGLRAVQIDKVEKYVEEKWRHVKIDPKYADLLKEILGEEFASRRHQAEADHVSARNSITRLNEQRRKLLEAHYEGAISIDLLREEQTRISKELDAAEALLKASEVRFETIETTLQECLAFLTDCHQAYLNAPNSVRRRMNQAVFERFLVGNDGTAEAELTPTFKFLLDPELITADGRPVAVEACKTHRNRDWFEGIPGWLRDRWNTNKPRPAFAGLGLNTVSLVPPAGFEPALRP